LRDHQQIACRQLTAPQAERVANDAADAIALDRALADAARHGHAQARFRGAGQAVLGTKQARRDALAVAAQRGEISRAAQTRGGRKRSSGHHASRADLRDETLAALGATRIQHGTSSARLHAGTETVRARVLQFSGLKGALHGGAWEERGEEGKKEAGK
jgi:hypothetical protein